MYHKTVLVIVIVIAAVLIANTAVFAIGVGVSPAVINVSAQKGGKVLTELTITNTAQEPGIYIVSADELTDWIGVQQREIRLEAGEKKRVRVLVNPKKEGIFTTMLSVVGYPLDKKSFNAGSGLKVPLRVTVSGAPLEKLLLLRNILINIFVLIAVGGLGVLWYMRTQRRKSLMNRLGHVLHARKKRWWKR